MRERTSRTPHHLSNEAYLGQVRVSVTACIEGAKPIFQDAATVQVFVTCLAGAVHKHRCVVPVYTFMPEHCHFIVAGKDETSNAWRAICDFIQQTGFWLSQYAKTGWQKDFCDHIIRKTDDMKHQIRYIVNNPVRRGLVSNWGD